MEIVRNNGLRIRDTQTSMDVLRFPDVKLNKQDQIAWFGSPMYQLGTGTNDWLYGGLNAGGWQDITRPTTAITTIENIGLGIPNIGIVGLRGVPLKFDSTRISPYNTGNGQPYLDFPGLVTNILSNPGAWGSNAEYLLKGTNKQGAKVVRIMAPSSASVGKPALGLSGDGDSNLLEMITSGDNGIRIVAKGQVQATGEASYDATAVIGSLVVAKDGTIKILGSKSGSDQSTTLATFNINTGAFSLPGDFVLGSTTIRTKGTHNISFPDKDGEVVLDEALNRYKGKTDSWIGDLESRLDTDEANIGNCFKQMPGQVDWVENMQNIGSRALRYTTSAPWTTYIDANSSFHRGVKSSTQGSNGGIMLFEDIMGANNVPSTDATNGYYQPGYWLSLRYKDAEPEDSQVAGLGMETQCWHSKYGLILGSREVDTGIKIKPQSITKGTMYTLIAPAKNGTLALVEDVPTKSEVASTYAAKTDLSSYYKLDSSQYISRPIKLPAIRTHWGGGKVIGAMRMDIQSNDSALYPVLSFGIVESADMDIKKVEERNGLLHVNNVNNDIELAKRFGYSMALGGIDNADHHKLGMYVYGKEPPEGATDRTYPSYVLSWFLFDWGLPIPQWHCRGHMTITENLTIRRRIFFRTFYETADYKTLISMDSPTKNADKIDIKDIKYKDYKGPRYGVNVQDLENNGLDNLVETTKDGTKHIDQLSVLYLMINDLRAKVKSLQDEVNRLKH